MNFIKNMTLMQWVFALGVVVNVELGIAHGGVSLAGMFPDAWNPHIVAWANGLGWLGGIIMTSLAGIGVIPRMPAAVKVVAWLAICTVALALMASPAMAQNGERGNVRAPQVKLPIPLPQPNPLTAPSTQSGDAIFGNGDQLAKVLAKPFTDLANFINSDAASAATLATAIPGLQDGHGQQCWIAMGQFTAVLKAHPIPATLHAATDLEALRLAAMAANNLCQNAHCTQVFTDLSNSIQKASPVGVSIPVPSLSSLCAYVPQVTVIPPVPPTPGATPTIPQAK